ncbi:outer membrane protein OmpK [Ferrimonas kyonanensis]|uniref:outer membrane protein OmpK n=1 Tax=Ferrimonas kyonanensis TaxID=364763 RepID=UPI000423FFE8|nr:outer membrane protein OmpK [Ferrimonas kyonanensis]
MKKTTALCIALASTALMNASAQAEVLYQENSVRVGYQTLLDAEDKNANRYDQGYLAYYHTTLADWGSALGWLWLENPLDNADNQQGDDAGATTKGWLKIDYALGDTPFNLWLQSFFMGNTTCMEQNLYFGGSYSIRADNLNGTFGLGANYSYGSFRPANSSFNGANGYAAVVALAYNLTPSLVARGYYEAQFDRDDEFQTALGYDQFGYQVQLGVDYHINSRLMLSSSYMYLDSWGATKRDGGEMLFELGVKF